MTKADKKTTTDFMEVIRAELQANPDLAEQVEEEAFNAHIATEVFRCREIRGMTQLQLARAVDTQQSVISRIEDSDYDGRSLSLLKRIAKALGFKIRLEFYASSDDHPQSQHSTQIDQPQTQHSTQIEWRPAAESSYTSVWTTSDW